MNYDYVIIGSGIAGIAAATELSKKNISYVILEKKNTVGGHVITKHVDGCIVDLGFIFGNTNYTDILSHIKKYNIPIRKHPITFSTLQLGNTIYNNESNTSIYQTEIERFYKLASKMKWHWWLITFKKFCEKNNFSLEIQNNVFHPALSILFISKHAFEKPAYIIIHMLKEWVGLSKEKLPNLWTTETGNISIINHIIQEYSIPIKTNEEVLDIAKYNDKWTLQTHDNTFYCNKIICTCNPRILSNILHYTNKLQQVIIERAKKKTFNTY